MRYNGDELDATGEFGTMAMADRFDSSMRHLRKQRSSISESEIGKRVEESFCSCLPDLPDAMRVELFRHVAESRTPDWGDFDSTDRAGESLRDFIELFDQDRQLEDDRLEDSDWELIRELVDDFALELDTGLITYLMQFVLKRGLIS